MRRLGVSYLKIGMKIARAIYRADGHVVLGVGIELTENYIKQLPLQGITAVYVQDDRLSDIEINDVISDEMRVTAVKKSKLINDELANLYNKSNKDMSKTIADLLDNIHMRLDTLGRNLVDDLLSMKNPMLHLIDTRYNEDYIYSHMVNVAVISVLIGKNLGYTRDKLIDLAKGCLIIDIGIILGVPKEIRDKTDTLTDAEIKVIQGHPKIGYDFVRKMRNLSILSAHVCFQHHERFNGGGYPRALAKNDITEFGYISGLADVYDAITNNKNYKARVLPGKAREFLMVSRDVFFPAYIVDKFLEKIPVYPTGMSVLLSNNKEGVIMRQNKDALGLPIIRIIKDGEQELEKWYDIDMQTEISVVIKQILD